MLIAYTANGTPGEIRLPTHYVEDMRPEDLAELAASDFWRHRAGETPTLVTLIHLEQVDGQCLGQFEVRREWSPVYTATALSIPALRRTDPA